eukprot:CAMPEP_0178707106 /NCGR_PEP_ID=MMETSP0699-20121125/15814_1 /TAXON_ID=265572 /ORGANISM="Extubocellulus spinifer, Strain CCMP396" /LENGTH=55 /DNA_ID=CAMNT_0020355053 /DNA_START=707 /DNA_END=874 /DNA_ORIENTATION=-
MGRPWWHKRMGWDGVERTGNGEMEEREGGVTSGIWWSLETHIEYRAGRGEDGRIY